MLFWSGVRLTDRISNDLDRAALALGVALVGMFVAFQATEGFQLAWYWVVLGLYATGGSPCPRPAASPGMTESRRTILYVHPSDELYGSDRCLLDAIAGLQVGDRAIVVLPEDLPYDGLLSQELHAAGADVLHVDMLVLRRSFLRPQNLPALIRRLVTGTLAIRYLLQTEAVDIVHSNTVAVPCGAVSRRIDRHAPPLACARAYR